MRQKAGYPSLDRERSPMPTNQPPVFTLEAINAMIPRLNELGEVQMQRRYGIESKLKALQSIIGDLPDEIVVDPKDPQEVKDLKEEIARKIAEYHTGWREVESMGAVLKDARIGLVDFYGNID